MDLEPDAPSERAELLAVVRGLEALDQPSRVTLVTRSRYVSRGIVRCLDDWRATEWQWERFGRIEPIRDQDLWQRVDRALEFHRVDCLTWPADEPTAANAIDAAPAPRKGVASDSREHLIHGPSDEPAVLIVKSRSAPRNREQGLPRRWLVACERWFARVGESFAAAARAWAPLPE
jgi:hypothetical protein